MAITLALEACGVNYAIGKKLLDSVTLVRYIRPTLHNCIEMTASPPPLRSRMDIFR
jgi:hypothetical protein